MDWILLFKAAVMGLVEGLTEFLPISSTGHLILVGSLIDFTGVDFGTDKAKAFKIIIQIGAIFAVCWEYRVRIIGVLTGFRTDPLARRMVLNLGVAFIPAMLLGLTFGASIKALLFSPLPVAIMLVLGGLIILWVERDAGKARHVRIETVDQIGTLDALKIGCAQAFALIPGTSRSGSTIIGGLLFGLSRKAATEFSFFLAIPTMFAATAYSMFKERDSFVASDLPLFSVGLIGAFLSAFLCVRWLLRYVSTHDFTLFAWYRIVFGVVVLATAYSGLLVWVD